MVNGGCARAEPTVYLLGRTGSKWERGKGRNPESGLSGVSGVGMGPRLPELGYSTPEVFPRGAGEASQAGSDRPCASWQAICPSPAPGTHPQDQLPLLQFKGRESFLSLGLCLPLGQGQCVCVCMGGSLV